VPKFHELAQEGDVFLRGLGQRGPDLADGTSTHADSRLHQGDRVALAQVAQLDERPVEAVQQPVDGAVVMSEQRAVEGGRYLGGKAEGSGRVERDADAAVGEPGEFRGGSPLK
jgi:hypothetical protein